ncbi:MAG: hypothetical protein OdinLCB4_007500 [Candidatus Odinarchaeum yellowstonii]|uniref:Uncharacterized protein n=1 Tax=Odinarchaeota yellowstonii (strain LCB_4) TaxID=1841599 RepID=A0AAF0D265_ODILC|nr:MAG: hypothetical protein OdinLCB4_007500 [Candidatus Odinarchaeum yellowstonii]
MGEEERKLACEYLNFFLDIFGLVDEPCGEGGGFEGKVKCLEERLNEFIKMDSDLIQLLEVYKQVFEYRRKATISVRESLSVLKAVCDGSLTVNVKSIFYEEAKNRLGEASEIVDNISRFLEYLDSPESRQLTVKLCDYMRENNKVIKTRFQEARLFVENAQREFEKLNPGGHI